MMKYQKLFFFLSIIFFTSTLLAMVEGDEIQKKPFKILPSDIIRKINYGQLEIFRETKISLESVFTNKDIKTIISPDGILYISTSKEIFFLTEDKKWQQILKDSNKIRFLANTDDGTLISYNNEGYTHLAILKEGQLIGIYSLGEGEELLVSSGTNPKFYVYDLLNINQETSLIEKREIFPLIRPDGVFKKGESIAINGFRRITNVKVHGDTICIIGQKEKTNKNILLILSLNKDGRYQENFFELNENILEISKMLVNKDESVYILIIDTKILNLGFENENFIFSFVKNKDDNYEQTEIINLGAPNNNSAFEIENTSDGDGHIYIIGDCERKFSKSMFFMKAGKKQDYLISQDTLGKSQIRALKLGPDGNIYVLSESEKTIIKHNKEKKAVRYSVSIYKKEEIFKKNYEPESNIEFSRLIDPTKIQIAQDGTIYVHGKVEKEKGHFKKQVLPIRKRDGIYEKGHLIDFKKGFFVPEQISYKD